MTNVASLNAQRHLARAGDRMAVSFRRLATGLRIATAADDAAGLAMADRLRAQVRSLEQAKRNAYDGISLVQTTEGALGEVGEILLRMRELTIQAASGTVSGTDRATIDTEFESLVAEVDRIGRATEFNGQRVLDGSSTSLRLHVGFGTGIGIDTLELALSPALATSLNLDALDLGAGGDISLALTSLDGAIDSIAQLRGRFGAAQNRLYAAIGNLGVQIENLAAAESRIRDVDVAYETAQLARDSVLQQVAIAVLAQANAQPRLALALLG